MKTNISSRNKKTGEVRRTKIEEPKPTSPMLVRDCELAMNFSYGGTNVDDGEGNKVEVNLWVTGDWKVSYKGKEYLIKMEDNLNAFIEWINSQ